MRTREAHELLPQLFDLLLLFRQFLRIRVHFHDHLAIAVEHAEMEHIAHGGHDDQIFAPFRDISLRPFTEDINRSSHSFWRSDLGPIPFFLRGSLRCLLVSARVGRREYLVVDHLRRRRT